MPLPAVFAAALACGEGTPAQPADSAQVGAQPASTSPTLPSWSSVAWPSDRADALPLELTRDAGAAAALEATDEAVRTLARIGGRDAAAQLLERFAGRDPGPAALAAAGLLEPWPGAPGEALQPTGPWAALEQELWTRFAVAEDPAQQQALAFALARLGGGLGQSRWALAVSEADPSEAVAAASFEAVAILCARRHPLPAEALAPLGRAIDDERMLVRRAAIAALGRCALPSAERFAGSERSPWVTRLSTAIDDPDEDIARLAWKALAALGERPATIPAGVLGAEPAPWLVEVEAVRALAAHADTRDELIRRVVALDAAAITGTRAVVVWTALHALRRAVDAAPPSFAALSRWREALRAATPQGPRHVHELAVVRCELHVLGAIAGEPLDALERCVDGIDALPEHYGRVLAVDALASITRSAEAPARAGALLERAVDERPQIAAAAIAALADVEDPRVNALLREALLRADPGVLAAAAGAVAARAADRDKRDPEAVAVLEGLVRRVDDAGAIEARLSAIEALGGLARSASTALVDRSGGTGEARAGVAGEAAQVWLERAIVPLATDPNEAIRRAAWGALDGFDALRERFAAAVPTRFAEAFAPEVSAALEALRAAPAAGLRVHTATGAFDIAFAGAPSPIAQANLVALARAGRFDGLRFHRVVPGFVAQGGDPRGDGYGGPGWVLPCEWSDVRYERGTVGMALAGKDTGGSQFFVAHTRQPHLDGRFSVVGQVVAGLDVVDRLLPHERIDRVEVLPPVAGGGASP